MSRISGRHEKVRQAVFHALFRGEIIAMPTREEFLTTFCPELLKAYEPNVPYMGIRTDKHGRPVNWGSKGAVSAQNTRRKNEADAIWAECSLIIQGELDRYK